jgi:hypothetical protein
MEVHLSPHLMCERETRRENEIGVLLNAGWKRAMCVILQLAPFSRLHVIALPLSRLHVAAKVCRASIDTWGHHYRPCFMRDMALSQPATGVTINLALIPKIERKWYLGLVKVEPMIWKMLELL